MDRAWNLLGDQIWKHHFLSTPHGHQYMSHSQVADYRRTSLGQIGACLDKWYLLYMPANMKAKLLV